MLNNSCKITYCKFRHSSNTPLLSPPPPEFCVSEVRYLRWYGFMLILACGGRLKRTDH